MWQNTATGLLSLPYRTSITGDVGPEQLGFLRTCPGLLKIIQHITPWCKMLAGRVYILIFFNQVTHEMPTSGRMSFRNTKGYEKS